MEIHLILAGVCLIGLGLIHVIFPKQFNWKQELSSLSTVNKEMMYVHTFFIALLMVLVGILCITSAKELVSTTLGKRISLGLGIFWIARLLIQFFGYSSKSWRGKRMETAIHILFAIFWAYVSVIFILIYFE